jgi:hypothetical protein
MIQQMIPKVLKLIRSEKLRCAAVGIETDSTILPDEQKERQDRMQFLSSMGAFLQQAAPMAMQFPDMRGLLGGIMMFTLRTFSASRPLEKEFENFQKKLEALPPTPPPGQEQGDNGAAAAQATQAVAQVKAQTDTQIAQQQDQTKRYEIDKKSDHEAQKAADDHQYRMAQIDVEHRKLDLERQKLGLTVLADERTHDTERQDKATELANAQQDKAQEAQVAEQTRQDNMAQGDLDREQDMSQTEAANELENRKVDVQEKAIKAKGATNAPK